MGQNEDCSPRGNTSDSSERLLQRGSGERLTYKVLVKAELNTIKHSFYRRFSASHEDLKRNQRSNCQHLLDHRESKGIPEKHLPCFIEYTKAFDCVNHNKVWKTLKEMGIPNHLTCLLRNLHVGQEATVRTQYGTTDWCKIEKGV